MRSRNVAKALGNLYPVPIFTLRALLLIPDLLSFACSLWLFAESGLFWG
jgi:hypothetical protein